MCVCVCVCVCSATDVIQTFSASENLQASSSFRLSNGNYGLPDEGYSTSQISQAIVAIPI